MRKRRKKGWAKGRRPPLPEGEEGSHGPTPPCIPTPPTDPQATGAPAPHPPRQDGRMISPLRQDRGARDGGRSSAHLHAPAVRSRRNRDGHTNPRQHTRPPRPHSRGERRTGFPPPPKTHPPALERPRRADPPHREHTAPSQVGGNGTAPPPPPPQANQTEHGTGTGHAEVHGPRGLALPAPSTGTARGARATPTRGGGGRADAAGERAHTHTKDTWGKPEGQPNGARGTHRPHGMAYWRARIRDTRTGRPATHSAGNAGR